MIFSSACVKNKNYVSKTIQYTVIANALISYLVKLWYSYQQSKVQTTTQKTRLYSNSSLPSRPRYIKYPSSKHPLIPVPLLPLSLHRQKHATFTIKKHNISQAKPGRHQLVRESDTGNQRGGGGEGGFCIPYLELNISILMLRLN